MGIEKTNYDVVENEGKIDVCLVKSGPSSLPIMAMLILEEIDMQPSGSGIPRMCGCMYTVWVYAQHTICGCTVYVHIMFNMCG